MPIVIATISILVITGLVWFMNKAIPFKVCPICAGVSGTWVLLTAGVLIDRLQIADYELLVGLLMGGTVVGIAYQGEKTFAWARTSIFRFRVPVIVAGFVFAYMLLRNMSFPVLAVEAILLAFVTWAYFVAPYLKGKSKTDAGKVEKLEGEMKNCC